jgi:RNA polymerase sigma factor (sigma-70 family)
MGLTVAPPVRLRWKRFGSFRRLRAVQNQSAAAAPIAAVLGRSASSSTTRLARVGLSTDRLGNLEPDSASNARKTADIAGEHGGKLVGFGLRLGLSPEQAEDSAQEVLLRLFRTMQAGERIVDPRAWVFHAMYRLAMDEHRFRRRIAALRVRIAADRSARGGAGEPDVTGLSIWAAVDALPGRQRQVLYLRYKADLSFDEVASVMGITASGARATVTKALDRLRAVVGPEEDLS